MLIARSPGADERTLPMREMDKAVATSRSQVGGREIGGRRVLERGAALTYTDEELLAALRRLGSQLGKAPGIDRYRAFRREHGGMPDAGTILKRFGSWSEAVTAAGFTPNRRPTSTKMGARAISDEEIRRELWRVASVVGHAPSHAEYSALADRPSAGAIRLRHGGWTAALEAHFPSSHAGVRAQKARHAGRGGHHIGGPSVQPVARAAGAVSFASRDTTGVPMGADGLVM